MNGSLKLDPQPPPPPPPSPVGNRVSAFMVQPEEVLPCIAVFAFDLFTIPCLDFVLWQTRQGESGHEIRMFIS